MKLHRIEAVVMRHLYYFRRNWDRLSDAIYWPVMDLVLWGLTTVWLQQRDAAPPHLLMAMLTGIVFWQIVWRANYEVSVNLLEETWTQNVVNMFATPLRVSEWVLGVMVIGVLKVFVSLMVGFGAAWILYSANLLEVGPQLVPFLVMLVLFGWALGFAASGLIVGVGRQIQSVAWMMGFLFAPISAVYYPVSALPHWIQPFAWMVPTTWVFEGMRAVLRGEPLSWNVLVMSGLLNVLYLSAALWFFVVMFERRRTRGLGQLE